MSILSSTNTGRKSIELSIEYLYNKGYRKVATYYENNYLCINLRVNKPPYNIITYNKDTCEFYSVICNFRNNEYVKVKIKSIKHLKLIENVIEKVESKYLYFKSKDEIEKLQQIIDEIINY